MSSASSTETTSRMQADVGFNEQTAHRLEGWPLGGQEDPGGGRPAFVEFELEIALATRHA